MSDDRIIAAIAHPEGSAAALRARDYIFGRMAALGLNPRRATGEAVEAPPRLRGLFATGGAVENLIGVLPGTDPTAAAIVLMAHSDSVPGSPGAADDGAGVVTALEAVRALKAAGPHRRDVAVLITDGEETGLLGVRAFFASNDPLLKHIGMVLNMEARGGGGRVSMFETGARSGAAMALFAQTVKNTDSLSLMSEIYKYLPNSTDFTVVKAAGYPGYNFAFLGEQFDYHSPSSTAAALDQGSVQHMGDQVLALSRTLADAPALPGRTPDAIYADVLGGPVIAYPPAIGWLVLAVATALAVFGAAVGALRAGESLKGGEIVRGFGAGLFTLLATALVLYVAGRWIEGDLLRYRTLLANFGALFFGMAALGVGAALLAWTVSFRGGRRWTVSGLALVLGVSSSVGGLDPVGLGLGVVTAALAAACLGGPLKPWSGWLGLLLLGGLMTLVLQILGPPLTVATAWPLLIGGVAIAAVALLGRGRPDSLGAILAALVAGLVVAAHLGHLASPIFTAIGPDAPEALALLPLLGALTLYPLLAGWSDTRAGWIASAAAAGCGVLALAFAALYDPASARTPRPVQAFYWEDKATGQAWRASTLPTLEPWSRADLALQGQASRQADAAPVFGTVWRAPVRPVGLAGPAVSVAVQPAGADRRVTLSIAPHADGRELRLYLQPDVALSAVTVDGHATELQPTPGRWVQLRWAAPAGPLVLAFTAKAGGRLDLRYEEIADGWPPGVAAPPKPVDAMPWGLSDDTVLTDRLQTRW